jgi:acetyl-CoA acetyltransferase
MGKAQFYTIPPDQDLSDAVAIVGAGDTDYRYDYETARKRESPPNYDLAHRLAVTALERALSDAGLQRRDVDGVGAAYGEEPVEIADSLGIRPRHTMRCAPIMAGVIPQAVEALAGGKCDTLALIYSAPMRSVRRTFGGDAEKTTVESYDYYHPWGWSSQAAHWALMFSHYQSRYGATEADLGVVAVTLRENARRNENAIMREPIGIDDYLKSRYVVSPMHLLDMCLVNDGAVCLILQRSDLAARQRKQPILVSGWANAFVPHDKFRYMVVEALRPQYQEAGSQALDMARLSLRDVDHFEGYDAASILLVNQLEGYGFAPPGEGLQQWKDGHMSLGGRLPVNTSGGMLSESYMQGWSHVVEAVRQLRHEAGDRQVEGASVSMTSLSTTDEAYPLIFRRSDA